MARFRTGVPAGILLGLLVLGWLVGSLPAQDAPKQPPAASKPTSRAASALDQGSITSGLYHNSSFGLTCKVSFGWVDRTAEMREGDSREGNEPAKSRVLLAVFERPPEATGSTINSAIVIAAEKLTEYSGLKTALDYFGPITELATAKGFKVVNEPYEFPVGAKQLVRGDFSKPRGSLTMVQSSLVMLEKGYVVSFTFIGGSEDEVNGLVENLSFAAKKGSGPPHK
jgi:hypothetical protein